MPGYEVDKATMKYHHCTLNRAVCHSVWYLLVLDSSHLVDTVALSCTGKDRDAQLLLRVGFVSSHK